MNNQVSYASINVYTTNKFKSQESTPNSIHFLGVENKDLHREAKISYRHASILKQFAVAPELLNEKSLECQLLVWLCE
jgi:hypothetical protein